MQPNAPEPVTMVRLIALAGVFYYGVELVANVLQSYDTVSPSYLGYYFKQQLARPVVGIVASVVLALLARRLGRWVGKPGA